MPDFVEYQQLQEENARLQSRLAELEQKEINSQYNNTNLQQNLNRFRFLIENTNLNYAFFQVIFHNDLAVDLLFYETNPAFEQLTGLKQVIGKRLSDLTPQTQADTSGLLALFGQAAQNGRHYQVELYVSGVNRWFDIKLVSLEKDFIMALFDDITKRKLAEIELCEGEEKYQAIIKHSSQGILLVNEMGIIIEWNPAQEKLTGILRSEAVGQPVWEVQFRQMDPEQRTKFPQDFLKQRVLTILEIGQAPGMDQPTERSIKTPSGESKFALQHISIIKTSQGYHIFGFAQDITDFKRVETELRESGEKLRLIFENAFDGINIYEELLGEEKRILLDCNERYCEMAGRSKEELMAVDNTQIFQRTIENAPEEEDREAVMAEHVFSGVFSWIRPDSKENIIEYHAAPRKVGEHYFTIGLDRDITERKQLQDKLRQQATTDELTGISNRRYFLEIASLELIRAERLNHPVSLALFDIDYFKQINDTYGHAAGDQALKGLSKICKDNIRTLDVFARLGGDEFALLMPETNPSRAYTAVERIRLALTDTPLNLDGKLVSITMSAGISSLNGYEIDLDLDMFLIRTDNALYQAKQAGRNCTFIDHAPGLQQSSESDIFC